MKRPMTLIFVLVFGLVLAACGEAVDEDTTTTSAPEAPTTTVAEETTTSTGADETTTTSTADEPEATGDLARLQAAMSESAEASPSRIEGAIAVQLPDGESAEMPMSMSVDPESGDSSMSMDMAAMAQASGETEDMPPEMAEMMGSMEVRQIGDTVYLSFPFFTAFLGADTEWVSMPAEEDMADEMTSGPTPDDPGHFLESFSETEGTVEEIGSEEIRGIGTTHYRLMVEEDWQDELSEEELSELEEQGPLPDSSFPIDLWVGDDGLVHRMAMDFQSENFPGTEDDEIEGMSMTFDFFDFGESVAIEAPPADQVTDISELSGPMGTFEQP